MYSIAAIFYYENMPLLPKRFNRFYSKLILILVCLLVIFLIITFRNLLLTEILLKNEKNCSLNVTEIRRFRCLIEGSRKLPCLLDGGDKIYMPFEFIKQQFDVTGKLNKGIF